MKIIASAKRRKALILLAIGVWIMTSLFVVGAFSPVLAQEPTDSDNCIACHTDKEQVQALAKEEEVKSEATSGEG